ncbi:MAG TPA: HipA domain-containing protein, partial [Sphaerochaeta sp.]|nr:HipA domain-containing protein [Sphaerochaeta sp.]
YLLLFSFVTGNSDMHLKNFSLIADSPGTYVLAPAYDLLPVTLLLEDDKEEMALTLCGEKKKLSYAPFLQFGRNIGIADIVIHNLIKKPKDSEPTFRETIEASFVSEEMKTGMKQLVTERLHRLSPQ